MALFCGGLRRAARSRTRTRAAAGWLARGCFGHTTGFRLRERRLVRSADARCGPARVCDGVGLPIRDPGQGRLAWTRTVVADIGPGGIRALARARGGSFLRRRHSAGVCRVCGVLRRAVAHGLVLVCPCAVSGALALARLRLFAAL